MQFVVTLSVRQVVCNVLG